MNAFHFKLILFGMFLYVTVVRKQLQQLNYTKGSKPLCGIASRLVSLIIKKVKIQTYKYSSMVHGKIGSIYHGM